MGGSNPYWYVACEFTAAAASATLAVVNDATGDQTLLVDDFKIAPSTGRWSVAPWNGDIDSGVDSTYLYTHAYNFGSSASPVITVQRSQSRQRDANTICRKRVAK